ncbi:GDSL-type esterase/lipase family protein [Akkermansia sp. N21169]|mgnify:CR=1 FL=1|jgi:acyl-CoA thioesterase-1|nr:GDSL-type esterase/lipase family protein [Akkermansia sp. N21169]
MNMKIGKWIGRAICLLLAGSALQVWAETTKVACVGDSITFGYGIGARETMGYPAVLGKLLGPGYEVKNFGNSGKTAGDYPSQKKNGRWYGDTPQYKDSVAYAADVYICNLGINDTGSWWDARLFEQGYDKLLTAWHKANPKAHLLAWGKLGPDFRGPAGKKAFPGNVFAPDYKFSGTDNGSSARRGDAEKLISRVGGKHKVKLFDAYTAMASKPQWYGDGLHPNASGARRLAEITFAKLVPVLKIKQPVPVMKKEDDQLVISNSGETGILMEMYAISGPGRAVFVFGKDTVLHPGEEIGITLGEKTANDPTEKLCWKVSGTQETDFQLRPLKKPFPSENKVPGQGRD